jgi:PASTA domain-containing protein
MTEASTPDPAQPDQVPPAADPFDGPVVDDLPDLPASTESPAAEPPGATGLPAAAEPPGATGPAGDAGLHAAGGTSIIPAVDGPAAQPRWSARAQVPTRTQPDEPEAGPFWAPGSGPLMPVLITLAVLVLLGLLGLGLWLLLSGNQPGPSPSPTLPAVTSAPPATTAKPTTAPATTAPATSAPPTSTAPALVTIPDLHNQPAADALAALTGLGLQPVQVDQSSTEVGAGKVIGTDPAAGGKVAPGTSVQVFVSTGPPPSPSPSPTASPSST